MSPSELPHGKLLKAGKESAVRKLLQNDRIIELRFGPLYQVPVVMKFEDKSHAIFS